MLSRMYLLITFINAVINSVNKSRCRKLSKPKSAYRFACFKVLMKQFPKNHLKVTNQNRCRQRLLKVFLVGLFHTYVIADFLLLCIQGIGRWCSDDIANRYKIK